MILSNASILRALDERRLTLDPEPAPRYPTPGANCPFQTSSVDLRLGDEISWMKAGLAVSMDLRDGKFTHLFERNSETVRITVAQPFMLSHGQYVLGRTKEVVGLPIRTDGPCLAARIEGRSSYARSGLLVHFTAPTIHAGFQGSITLEMINLGPYPIGLYPGAPICQLILEQVEGTPYANESQFHNQRKPGGSGAPGVS